MLKIKFLVIAIVISFAGIIASCYYDYGIDPDSSNVVVTAYNNQYDFGAITRYNLIDTVFKEAGVTNAYDAQILQDMRNNLNALGWRETNSDSTTGPGLIVVGAGITSSTVVVSSGYDPWGYYGYGWYYPDYYSYTYTYTTGTLFMLMADYNAAGSSTNAPVEWSGTLNGATGQTTSTSTLISQGINQAFSQSPYLR